ncbi:MAG TPA: hypothetical protein EYP22_04265 [Methanosarcinales archaeon]|nr:hypothetical protein [Methanosarcinales archaeon]
MKPVNDIELKGFKEAEKGLEATTLKSEYGILVRLPKIISDLYHLDANIKLPIKTELNKIILQYWNCARSKVYK